jgi:hypothetical protein
MARKCAKCGVVSEIEEAFQKSNYSDKIFYCPACSKEKSVQLGESFLIACPIVLIGGIVWVMVNPRNEFAWLVFQAGLFMCFWVVLTVPHELGHVLAAFVTRAKVSKVTIGLGRILCKRELLGIEWEFRVIPICGSTIVGIGDRNFYRIRNFLISSGGPLINFLLGTAALILLFFIYSPWPVAFTKAFMFTNIFELVHNLLPTKWNTSGGSMSSDGLRLLMLPLMSKSKIDKEIEGHYAWWGYSYISKGRIEDARKIYEKGLALFPDSAWLQRGMGRVLLELGNYADARSMFMQLYKRTDLAPDMVIRLLNDIAGVDIKIGTQDLLDEADIFSRTACEKMLWQTEFKWTRGYVLIEKGNVEQGLALLREVMTRLEPSPNKEALANYIAEYESKKSSAV